MLDLYDSNVEDGTAASASKRYLHGPGVDMVLAQENLSHPLTNKDRVWWLLPDQLGSTRDVVNNSGETVAHFQYDAYGVLLDGRENVTRYQFTGREHDSNTDYNYHRARWYDPVSGKWLSEDPIGFAAGDYNLSRYVNNGPTNATDPSGLAEAVGHHWIPVYTINSLSDWLTEDAILYALGNASGELLEPHTFRSYGGVTHSEYNTIVTEQLEKLIEESGRECIGLDEMKGLLDNIRDGKDRLGKVNRKLKLFNDAIRKERAALLKGAKDAFNSTDEVILKRGRGFLNSPRFWGSVVGMAIISLASDAVGQEIQALDLISENEHFKRAIELAIANELGQAQIELTGHNSLYDDLVDQGLDKAANHFKHSVEVLFDKIRKDAQKLKDKCQSR